MFSYTVVEGDLATDGVSIEANRLSLNGGTIKDGADNDAVLDHDVVAADSGHKVDGVKPRLQSATVNEAELTLAYGEALDGSAPPAAEDFTVNVEGAGRSVSGVSVSGRAVTLTLALAVEHGEVVAVSYGPGTNPIQDAAGNAAEGLSGEQVTNNTEAPNTAPEITSPGSFDVIENQARVTWLTATDADEGDEVTGWAITGGADRGRFAVVADTGELSFRANPDFEAPSDVLSTSPPSDARDNEYIVVVRATTGAGDRDLMAEQPIRVRVADEDEPPGKPEPTTFSEEMRDSLTVRWTEPENIGPDITNYDVRYQEGGGGFTDAQHEGTGLTATLTGLSTGTAYQVQVRASNEEGMSDWSEPGEGRTIAPLTVQMTPFPPPPVEAQFAMRFSFSEEVNGFTSDDIAAQQEPPCTDSENNPVSCNPSFTALQTTDDRIFTTAVTPRTERVAHNYTLTISVQVGGVTSLVGNKPNEAATLEVRIAPPGVTVPISSIGLTANPGNDQVTLRWDAPTASGGSAIIRYEYRWAETGGEFGDWVRVDPAGSSAAVPNLTNGRDYVFEARGVNVLGYGGVETAMAMPVVGGSGRGGGGGGGGSGGGGGNGGGVPRQTVPDAPTNLLASAGDTAVTLTWDGPEDDGGSAITDYQYGINGRGWTSIGTTGTTHTVTGLVNDTVYAFQVRAVNRIGRSRASLPAEGGGGSGLCAFRQWDRHHLRDGARECGPPSDPARPLLLRSAGPSH